MIQRIGISKQQFSHWLSTAKQLQEKAEKPLLKGIAKDRRRRRLNGAGRKMPFPKELAQLKQ